jgi:predicted enzyme related to lactoylglutathione lyase
MPAIDVLFAGVPVTDLDASIAWYSRLLGREPDIPVNDDEVMWQCSQAGWLYLLRGGPAAGHAIVTVAVADLEVAVGEIGTQGISGSAIEKIGDAGRKANFTDPDGNTVSFIEVNAPSGSSAAGGEADSP